MRNKIFFCSDFHLGLDARESSKQREKLILEWLEWIRPSAEALYIVGDIFDFWFEYRQVVPKGGIRLLAALAQLKEEGTDVHIFTGNHDQWMFGYFESELGIPVYSDPVKVSLQGKQLMIGHGDGLGPGDRGYKFIKKVFRHPISRKIFGWFPPGLGIPIARYWSGASRKKGKQENKFMGEQNEWLIQYSLAEAAQNPKNVDYFIFGHRHLPIDWTLPDGSRYINLGDWLEYHSYAVLENGRLNLAFYKNSNTVAISNNKP